MGVEDPWDVLGVDREADQRTIRKAYLKAIKSCRPETDPEGFGRIRAAYEALSSPQAPDTAAVLFVDPAQPETREPEQQTTTADDCIDLLQEALEDVEQGRLNDAQENLRKMRVLAEAFGGWALVCEDPIHAIVVARLEELFKVQPHLTEQERDRLARAFVHDVIDDIISWWGYIRTQEPERCDRLYDALLREAPTIVESFDWEFEDHQEAGERHANLMMFAVAAVVGLLIFVYKTLSS